MNESLVKRLRVKAFVPYARFTMARYRRRLPKSHDPLPDGINLTALRASERPEVEAFLKDQLSVEDRAFAGLKADSVNFSHPCIAYFGLYSNRELVGLFLAQLLGRGLIEDYIAIGKDARGKGLMAIMLKAHAECCRQLQLTRRVRINKANKVMSEYYQRRGYRFDVIEKDCFVLELD